jgi:hypothetical protein
MDVFHSVSLLKHYTRPDDSREPSMRKGREFAEKIAEQNASNDRPQGRLLRTG